jgi:hypothetical protein
MVLQFLGAIDGDILKMDEFQPFSNIIIGSLLVFAIIY